MGERNNGDHHEYTYNYFMGFFTCLPTCFSYPHLAAGLQVPDAGACSRGFCSAFLGAGLDAGILGALLLDLAAGSFLTGSTGLVPTGFIALSDAILLRYPVKEVAQTLAGLCIRVLQIVLFIARLLNYNMESEEVITSDEWIDRCGCLKE
ncbi:hypothetical protein NC653_021002 [Populus alba x Populus x berolinensis]|uniref:Uncharacterized protein n=1 Tax=Populus alba x Populus x berolinensis TaxID=444605 RepID=A0AAD6MLW2_9ROSI|nr:hypothetical protein NC653_021002 [Populus alba x Populus x berolinensis]